LKAERFTAAGRQHGEDVLARESVADDFLLQRAKRREAEIFFQRVAQLPVVVHGESFSESEDEFKCGGDGSRGRSPPPGRIKARDQFEQRAREARPIDE